MISRSAAAITASASLRPLLPLVGPEHELAVRKTAFHCVSALHAAHGGSRAWLDWQAPETLPEWGALARRAARSGGDHAIKLASAVLQEYSLRPDPALIAAADREITRVRG